MIIHYVPWQGNTRNTRSPSYQRSTAYQKEGYIRPLEDDNDIDWKHNPFDVDFIDDEKESPAQLMSKITFKGSPQLQTRLRALVREFIDVYATKVCREPVAVEPMKIVIDEDKWRLPYNRQPPRKHSEEKQKVCTAFNTQYGLSEWNWVAMVRSLLSTLYG